MLQALQQMPSISSNTIASIAMSLLTAGATAVGAERGGRFAALRSAMVEQEIVAAGISHPRVLRAMRETPRHEFIPLPHRHQAYYDMALPIGEGQTISPPFVVAYMTEQLDPQANDRVLEIGTGSGYQAAVLSPLVQEVYTIEIVGKLGRRASRTLSRLGYDNVHTKIGDGYEGWPEQAPFDKIIVTCSPEDVPQPLTDQLREGGQIVVPVGERYRQNLYRLTKREGRLERETLTATLFVPMTGEAESQRKVRPDPLRPQLYNGSFEALSGPQPQPEGWHYQRQLTVISDRTAARQGNQYVRFENSEPGRASHALQGFAIDGRQVSKLRIRGWIRGHELRPGQDRQQWAAAIVSFFDSRRAVIDNGQLGPWRGSFAWQQVESELSVPIQAREAILRIGLHGGLGQLDVDGWEFVP